MPDAPPAGSEPPPRPKRRLRAIAVDVSSAQRVPLSRAAVRDLVSFALRQQRVSRAIVSIAFISNRQIAGLNRRTLGHRGATDIVTLAFRRRSAQEPVVSDVYIATDVVRRNAAAARVSAREETARVVIHGVLHALGHDHPETDRERSPMWRLQERLLDRAKREGLW